MRINETAALILSLFCLSGCLTQNSGDGETPPQDNTTVASFEGESTENVPPQAASAYRTLSTDGQLIAAISWSTDSEWIAVGTSTAIIWNITNNELVRRFERPDIPDSPDLGRITALRFSQGNRRLITSWGDGRILVWDVGTGNVVYDLKDAGPVGTIEVTNDPARIVVGTYNDRSPKVTLWDLDNSEKVWEIENILVASFAVNSESSLLLAGTHDSRAILIDIGTGKVVRTITVFDTPFYRVDFVGFGETGSTIRALGNQGVMTEWNLESNTILGSVDTPTEAPLVYSSFNPAASLIASIVYGEVEILVWNSTTGEVISRIETPDGERFARLAWSPDGAFVATVNFDGRLVIWQIP